MARSDCHAATCLAGGRPASLDVISVRPSKPYLAPQEEQFLTSIVMTDELILQSVLLRPRHNGHV